MEKCEEKVEKDTDAKDNVKKKDEVMAIGENETIRSIRDIARPKFSPKQDFSRVFNMDLKSRS